MGLGSCPDAPRATGSTQYFWPKNQFLLYYAHRTHFFGLRRTPQWDHKFPNALQWGVKNKTQVSPKTPPNP